ncbi:MAG: winged helix-turn-helix transcriptional regulator [Methanoregula sp.]|jgi:A/G-specific adenine glycosylase|nr:winged helix-turn-helix transcriptional regulator [Methanoregula sp.]
MVLTCYARHGRELAWRKTTDPYHILVSEIMLQQTQVDRVARKYPRFLQAFSDFPSLAHATLSDVLFAWQGMGYNRRAIALRKCAIRVIEEFGGELPADIKILATFPGIGKATASSICAFAFNQPVIFIETNIRRVFIYYFFRNQETVTDAEILPLVGQTLYRKDPRTWYNAVMDLGTDLKNTVPNPNRRSKQYSKQAAFEGSDRQIRGRILKMLLAEGRMTQKAIALSLTKDSSRIGRILHDLEEEGFITRSGTYHAIASR